MTGGVLGFVLFAIMIPLLVNEAGDFAQSVASYLLKWGARRIGRADQAERYEEEWLADLERVPGNLTKLGYACGVVVRSVPRLRAQFRQGPHGARLPGILPGHIIDTIGEQLICSLEIDMRLQHVAEMLVPRFADHCFIDLFHEDALICRVRRHAGGWTPPPGTWKQAGEQIRYPEGHFCQQAMARLDTVIVTDLMEGRGDRYPAPSAQSMATAKEVGLKSVISAPLYARGVLLGVMSLALSDLTDRTEQHYAIADRYLIGAIASQVAVAIDHAKTVRGRAPDRVGPSSIAPATSWP
jgi:GAF domain-containing protein